MRILLLIVLTLINGMPASADPLSSFQKSKNFLADLHEEIGHLETIYCGCPYARTTSSGGDVDREACGLKARSNETRSDRVEWEHVVPASWYGNTRACWILKDVAYSECAGKNGRKCCEKVNDEFRIAHNDPNNLYPSSGEVNGDRLNYPYGEVLGEPRSYGVCNFEVATVSGTKVAEPPEGAVRGVLARSMLYMAEVYGADVRLPMETVWSWHTENPPSPWEIERARLIAERTGLRNRWVLGPQ